MVEAKWGAELDEARRHLLECVDFATLRACGHELRPGVVLTSVSEIPFEMSLRCALCGEAYWFENLAWMKGGNSLWQFSQESRERSHNRCGLNRS